MRMIIQDLLEVGGGYLLNQVNCQGAYGSGVAGQLTKKWPAVKSEYLRRCNSTLDKRMLFGTYIIIPITYNHGAPEKNIQVVHLFSQYTFGSQGQHTNYLALTAALSLFRLRNPDSEEQTYIPYQMSCGLGGGDWTEVCKIIKSIMPDACICIPEWHADCPKPNVLWVKHAGGAYVWSRDSQGNTGWLWSTATSGGNPSIHEESPADPPPPTEAMLGGSSEDSVAERAALVPVWTDLSDGQCIQDGFKVIIPSKCARETDCAPKKTEANSDTSDPWTV